MAKSASDKDIEFHPDAWKRFERAIDTAMKSPPQQPEDEEASEKEGSEIEPKSENMKTELSGAGELDAGQPHRVIYWA